MKPLVWVRILLWLQMIGPQLKLAYTKSFEEALALGMARSRSPWDAIGSFSVYLLPLLSELLPFFSGTVSPGGCHHVHQHRLTFHQPSSPDIRSTTLLGSGASPTWTVWRVAQGSFWNTVRVLLPWDGAVDTGEAKTRDIHLIFEGYVSVEPLEIHGFVFWTCEPWGPSQHE